MMEGGLLSLISLGYSGRYEVATTREQEADSALCALAAEALVKMKLLTSIKRRVASGEALVEIAQLADRLVFISQIQQQRVLAWSRWRYQRQVGVMRCHTKHAVLASNYDWRSKLRRTARTWPQAGMRPFVSAITSKHRPRQHAEPQETA